MTKNNSAQLVYKPSNITLLECFSGSELPTAYPVYYGMVNAFEYNFQKYILLHSVKSGYAMGYFPESEFVKFKKKELSDHQLLALEYVFSAPGTPITQSSDNRIQACFLESSPFGYGVYTLEWSYIGNFIKPFNISSFPQEHFGVPVTFTNVISGADPEELVELRRYFERVSSQAKLFYENNSSTPNVNVILVAQIAEYIDSIEAEIWSSYVEEGYNELRNRIKNGLGANILTSEDLLPFWNALIEYRNTFLSAKSRVMLETDSDKMFALASVMKTNTLLKSLSLDERLHMIKVISEGDMSEFWFAEESESSSGEEFLVNRIIQSAFNDPMTGVDPVVNSVEVTKFLEGFNKVVTHHLYSPYYGSEDATLFQVLYKKIDTSTPMGLGFSHDHRKMFIISLYEIWRQSWYNPYWNGEGTNGVPAPEIDASVGQWAVAGKSYGNDQLIHRPILLNYASDKIAGFFWDNFDFAFHREDGSKGLWFHENVSGFWNDYNSSLYDIFQPISTARLVETVDALPVFHIPNHDVPPNLNVPGPGNCIPMFYLYHSDKAGDEEDKWTTLGYTVDAIGTVTGIGNLSKLRHLRYLSQFDNVAIIYRIKMAFGVIEVTASLLTMLSSLIEDSDFCQTNSTFCRALNSVNRYLEIASLGGDLLASRLCKKTAREAAVLGRPVEWTDNAAWDELIMLGDFNDELIQFVQGINSQFSSVANRLAGMSPGQRFDFMYDFRLRNGNQLDVSTLTEMNNPNGLFSLDDWLSVQHLTGNRSDPNFLIELRRVYDSPRVDSHALGLDLRANPTHRHDGLLEFDLDLGGGHHLGGINSLEDMTLTVPNVHPGGPDVTLTIDFVFLESDGIEYISGFQNGTLHVTATGPPLFRGTKFPQSVYPVDWSIQKIKEEIALAILNRKQTSATGHKFKSTFSDGTPCEIYYINGIFDNIFPVPKPIN